MQAITHFVQHSNPLILYIIVALILMLESSGVPIANTTVLLFMGAMASMGRLDHIVLACVALSGSVAGACLAYALGERGGRRALLRVMSFFRVGSDKIEIVEHWFNKSGMWMIFFSRMIPYVRPFACFPAGISRMRFWRFFLAALCGSTIWCIALLTIGWNLGRRWKLALSAIQE
ncbi:MAG: DedA family protein, partial [Ktedonobacteraceae bacterium]|nr:DedA family protein [Ktedonobacteraceae bacterium]